MNALPIHPGSWLTLAAALATSAVMVRPAIAQVPDSAAIDHAGEVAFVRAQKAALPRGAPVNLPPSAARIKGIVNRLVVQTRALDVPQRAYAWAFTSLPGDTPRLDVYPGGRVIINAGWIERLKLSDDELAAALAHALAHLLLGQIDTRVSAEAGDYADPDPNRVALRLAKAIDTTLQAPWTAEQELEADRIAVELAARAGYDPRAAITFWHKVDTSADRMPIQLHPMNAERVAALEARMPAALNLLAAARANAKQPAPLPMHIRRKGS